MERMTENKIEQFAIELLERSGYQEGVRCRVLIRKGLGVAS